MSADTTRSTLGRSKLAFSSEADISEFVTTLQRYEKGHLTADQWRAFRLVRGTYGQRQDDVQMLRVKIPQGIMDRPQLEAVADIAEKFSRGYGHITTRQNIQLHFVKLANVEEAMNRFHEAGLTTREACGNSVRNICSCPYSGVSPDEIFDTSPYAEALTRYFLRHRAAASLPRKFKIGFEGCASDHAQIGIHDIGWQARIKDGQRGFKVYVAGGTSILCNSGYVLYEFLPAEEMLNVAEAILRVYQGLGDYKHKARNRMKFLIKELGYERWKSVYEAALQQFKDVQGGLVHAAVQGRPGRRQAGLRRAEPAGRRRAQLAEAGRPHRRPGHGTREAVEDHRPRHRPHRRSRGRADERRPH
jgi:sulfite reductase beta subunit-like hemoprotein